MIKHSSPELYGAESVRYMNARNGFNAATWIIVLIICFVCIQYFVMKQYDRVGSEQSIAAFQVLLTLGFACMMGLSLLWWFITSAGWLRISWLRSLFEQNSKICAAAFSFLAFLSIFLLRFIGEFAIDAKNGHVYSLYCPFILPAVFVYLMYAAPPIHMQEVVFPGKLWARVAAAMAAALTATGLFMIDFL